MGSQEQSPRDPRYMTLWSRRLLPNWLQVRALIFQGEMHLADMTYVLGHAEILTEIQPIYWFCFNFYVISVLSLWHAYHMVFIIGRVCIVCMCVCSWGCVCVVCVCVHWGTSECHGVHMWIWKGILYLLFSHFLPLCLRQSCYQYCICLDLQWATGRSLEIRLVHSALK